MWIRTGVMATFSGLLCACSGVGGRVTEPYFKVHPPANVPPATASPLLTEDDPRDALMFTGSPGLSGIRLTWLHLSEAVAWADVVIIGEQHNDAIGHAMQLAIVEDVVARCPGRCCALSMEMLERDEQELVDDYLEGIVDSKTFAKETFSESWAGEGSWFKWYQPIIDAAEQYGARVIAANAPRRYVRLARTDDYDRLRSLPAHRRALFALPLPANDAAYRRRFFEIMSEGDGSATRPASQPATAASQPSVVPEGGGAKPQATTAPGSDGGHGAGEMTRTQMEATYRSQSIWDATMADSIARARRDGAKKVIHLVGQFHCDFDGGLVQQLRTRRPSDRILVVSMQADDATALRGEDRGRADVVVYTGKHAEPGEHAATAPASAPATSASPSPSPSSSSAAP